MHPLRVMDRHDVLTRVTLLHVADLESPSVDDEFCSVLVRFLYRHCSFMESKHSCSPSSRVLVAFQNVAGRSGRQFDGHGSSEDWRTWGCGLGGIAFSLRSLKESWES